MKSLLCISAVLLSMSCLQAEEPPAVDPDLPQPLDFSFADSLSQSPFTRSVNLENTLQLTGVAYINGSPVATVLNKQTKQSVFVTEQPNELGWRLLAADAGADPSNTQIQMMVGPETITMHYHGQEMNGAPEGKGGSKTRLAGAGSGKGGEKFRTSSLLGDEGKKLYASLSPEGRDKFKDLLKSRMEKHPEMTPEQNSDYAKKVFAKIKATDQPSSGGAKTPKSGKVPKKKQGA
ncbi:MAG: hypothetical protein V4662_19735 [Verrucomicrobiota bacterium]